MSCCVVVPASLGRTTRYASAHCSKHAVGRAGLRFLGGSVGKLGGAKSQIATAERLQIGWSQYRTIAIPESAAVIGLLLGYFVAPLGVAAAGGLALLMLGAAAIRAMRHDSLGCVVGDLTICTVAIVTAVARALSA